MESAEWRQAHVAGKTQRVDTMRAKTRGLCISGHRWTLTGESHCGGHHAVRDDGYRSMFAGCAEWLVDEES